MKYLLFLMLAFFVLSCSSDDDSTESCKCEGRFQLVSDAGTDFYFYVSDVDCENGNPVTVNQANNGQPVTYFGCTE